MLSTFLIILLISLYSQNIKIYHVILLGILTNTTVTLYNTVKFLIYLYLALWTGLFIREKVEKKISKKMNQDQLKSGDLIYWHPRNHTIDYPLPDLVQLISPCTGYTHIGIVVDGHILHSVLPNSTLIRFDKTDLNYHFHEKIAIPEFFRKYIGNEREVIVRPIMNQTYIQNLDYVNMKRPRRNILEKLLWLLNEPFINKCKFSKQLELTQEKYDCIGFVKLIQQLNKIDAQDYAPHKNVMIS